MTGCVDGSHIVSESSWGRRCRAAFAAAPAAIAACVLVLCGCAPTEGGVESAASSHAHPDHTHVAARDHAPHAAFDDSPDAALELVDIDGVSHGTLAAPARGRWTSLLFVRTDCPIANHYAPEIRRICAEHAESGVECLLVYVDGHLTVDDVRQHVDAFDYALPAILDEKHALVARAGATITPEAAVFAGGAELAYRGRIDNLYAELGRPRRQATERDLKNALDDLAAGRPVRKPQTQATGCYIE